MRRLLLLLAPLAAGCARVDATPAAADAGPPLSGRVAVRGADPAGQSPLEGGRVTFEPVNGGPVGVARIDADGSFRAATVRDGVAGSGLAPGAYRVRVEPPRDKGGPQDGLVAAKYRSAKTSGLTVTAPAAGEVVLEVGR